MNISTAEDREDAEYPLLIDYIEVDDNRVRLVSQESQIQVEGGDEEVADDVVVTAGIHQFTQFSEQEPQAFSQYSADNQAEHHKKQQTGKRISLSHAANLENSVYKKNARLAPDVSNLRL